MTRLLLNSDIGEWESAAERAAIFPHLDLANVACGGHAGTLGTMQSCADLALKYEVKTGAHPGTTGNRGRGDVKIAPNEFQKLVLTQIETFLSAGLRLNHIKLHGALYHLSEADHRIRASYLKIVRDLDIPPICLAGGTVAADCKRSNYPHLAEAFLDRGYLPNGQLVPRKSPGASIKDWPQQKLRLRHLAEQHPIEAFDGTSVPLKAETVCIHADHPGSAALAAKAREFLDEMW